MDNITDDKIEAIAVDIAKDFIENGSDMRQCMLMNVIKALENGEDVDDGLLGMVLTRPFMEKFIDELLKLEKE